MRACITPGKQQTVDSCLNRLSFNHLARPWICTSEAAVPWISSLCAEPVCGGCGVWRNTFEQTISRSKKKWKEEWEKNCSETMYKTSRPLSNVTPTSSTQNGLVLCCWILCSRSPPPQYSMTIHRRLSAGQRQGHCLFLNPKRRNFTS